MRTAVKILFVFSVLTFIAGCSVQTDEDGTKRYKIRPSVEKKLEQAEEVGGQLLGVLGSLAPLLGPIGGVVVGGVTTGLAVLKKARPKLKDAQDKHELFNTVASISVDALEQVKKDHPEIWDNLAGKVHTKVVDSGLDTKLVKNAIRGLRGLSPKV